MYDEAARFRSSIDMARYRFGSGQYRYFDHPFPDRVTELREAFYPHLFPVARDWARKRGQPAPWPGTLAEWLAMCHAAGQTKPTPILLRYREGDWKPLAAGARRADCRTQRRADQQEARPLHLAGGRGCTRRPADANRVAGRYSVQTGAAAFPNANTAVDQDSPPRRSGAGCYGANVDPRLRDVTPDGICAGWAGPAQGC